MDNGEPAKLTLNLGALYALRAKEPELWDRYTYLTKTIEKKKDAFSELEGAEMIYIAYRCANVGSDEEPMTLEEFLCEMTDDREEMGRVFQQLMGVKEKKPDFQMPSGKQHGKKRRRG